MAVEKCWRRRQIKRNDKIERRVDTKVAEAGSRKIGVDSLVSDVLFKNFKFVGSV